MFECFCCPVCGHTFVRDGKTLRCTEGHSFDIASGEYVNLWITNRTHAGDSKGMIAARHRFLESGSYGFLLRSLQKRIGDHFNKQIPRQSQPFMLDAGCGEGYYTAGVATSLHEQGLPVTVAGVDISKAAIRRAVKRGRDISFAVASLFKVPLPADRADCVLSVFAPVCGAESARILRSGGLLFIVYPGPRHLFGLKRVLYEKPYENQDNTYYLPDFEKVDEYMERREILVRGSQLNDLFAMTPYYWRTPADAMAKLERLPELSTELDFRVAIYKKQ